MHTKTTTAVLLALFSSANAADLADQAAPRVFQKAFCAGAFQTPALLGAQLATGEAGAEADVIADGITDQATCADAAKTWSTTNAAKKVCVQWRAAGINAATVGDCLIMVKGDDSFGAEVKDPATATPVATALDVVFMLNGKYQDNEQDGSAKGAAAAAEPAGNGLPASVSPTARTCTCTVALTCQLENVPKVNDKTVMVDGTEKDKDGAFIKVPSTRCFQERGDDGEVIASTTEKPNEIDSRMTNCLPGTFQTNYLQRAYADQTKADAALKVCADAAAIELKADPKYKTPACTHATDLALETIEECPSGIVVPLDQAPAAPGSFKGYTNRWTMSNVGGDDIYTDTRDYVKDFKGKKVEYSGNESANMNAFSDSAQMGAIIGFAVFGLGIIYAVIMIAIDMKKRLAMYEEMIVDDIAVMQKLGMASSMAEFDRELGERLAGGKGELGVDDQLVTQALELRAEEFAKYM